MTRNDLPEFKSLMKGLQEYYRRDLSSSTLALMFNALKDWDIKWVRLGVERHMQDPDQGRFMPTAAHIKAAWMNSVEWDQMQWDRRQKALEGPSEAELLERPETPVDRDTPRLNGPSDVGSIVRQLPWDRLGISRDAFIEQRTGRKYEPVQDPQPREHHYRPPPVPEDEDGERTRERALEALKGRKPILEGYS